MRRWLIAAGALLLGLPLLAVAGLALFLDADSLRPRVVAAVEGATGRRFVLDRLHLTPALAPTVVAEGVRLGNVEGGSAPDMLRARRAEIRLALLPLLSGRVELHRIAVEDADLLIEQGNWRFAPRAAEPAPSSGTAPSPRRPARPIELRELALRDIRATIGGEALRLPRADIAQGADGGLELRATLLARGAEVALEGRAAGLGDGPFRLAATWPGARVTAEGERGGAELRARVTAEAPALAALSGLAGRALPPLTGVVLRAEVALAGGPPQVTRVEARVAGGEVAGLALAGARLEASAADRPLSVEAAGSWRGLPLRLAGDGPPLAALTGGGPLPVALTAALGAAEARVAGPLPLPGRAAPGPLAVSLAVPDLAALAPAAGRPLPPLRELRGEARLAWTEGRLTLGGLRLASSAGDLAGEASLALAGKPNLQARLAATRLDLDALRPAPAPAPPAAAPAAPAPARDRLIPDLPLDLAALNALDADVTLEAQALTLAGQAMRQAQARLLLVGGAARLDPFAATLPGGRLSLRLAADANARAVQLAGGGQGLDLAALLPALDLAGRTDLEMDLRAQGATTRALAATLTGTLGLALTEGRIGPRLAGGIVSGLPGAQGGAIPLACLAVRAVADRGAVRFGTLYAEGGLGRAAGEGGLNLADESLALRFSTDLRVAGVRLRAPVPLTGTLLRPRLDWGGVAQGALAGDLGRQAERFVPGLGSVLPQQAGPALPDCGAALAAARGGRAGPVPRPAEPPPGPAAPRPAPPQVEQLLRGLFGR